MCHGLQKTFCSIAGSQRCEALCAATQQHPKLQSCSKQHMREETPSAQNCNMRSCRHSFSSSCRGSILVCSNEHVCNLEVLGCVRGYSSSVSCCSTRGTSTCCTDEGELHAARATCNLHCRISISILSFPCKRQSQWVPCTNTPANCPRRSHG